MSRYLKLLVGMLVMLISYGVFGQSYTMTVIGSGSASGCGGPRSFKLDLFNQSGTLISTQSTSGFGATITHSFSSMPITFRVMALGQDQCGGSVPQIPAFASIDQTFTLSSANSDPCGNFSWDSFGEYDLNVTVTIEKSIPKPVEIGTNNCEPVKNLFIDDNAPSYNWQVSESLTGSFVTFRSNAPKNIMVTINDLDRPGFTTSKFANRFIRAVGTGCQRTSEIIIVKFDGGYPVLGTPEITHPKCSNDASGSIKIDITNAATTGINKFFVRIFDPQKSDDIDIDHETLDGTFTYTFHNLSTKNPITGEFELNKEYRINVQNNEGGGCSVDVFATLNNPPAITTISLIPNAQVSCNGLNGENNDGIIQLQVGNGTGPYSYQVKRDEVPVTLTPDGYFTPTPTFSGLTIGVYKFTVTDSKGCQASEIMVPVDEPPAIALIESAKTNVQCKFKNTAAIDLTVSGGNGGYNFNWTATGPYAPYSIPAVEDPANLFAGDYSLTVTDAKGCSNTAPLNVSITEPVLPVILDATVPSRALHGGFDMSCALNDGIIELDLVNEALPVASYTWTKDGNPFTPSSYTFAEDLTPGNYEITAIDGNNCDATQSITLNAHPGIIGVTRATSDYNGFNTKCPDTNEGEGLIESVTNAFGSLSYTWFDGSTDPFITDLLPGNYLVTIIDGNGCSDDATLVITPPPAIQPNIQITSNYNGESITCPGASDGAMESFPTNGFGAYTYLWDHGPTTPAISDLSQDTYSVTVTDGYGCSVKNSMLISDPATIQLNFSKKSYNGSDLSCHDSTDGEVQLNVVNGISPYTYAWSQGGSGPAISGLASADYSVTVTDQNNCIQTSSISIINPEEFVLEMQHPNNFNSFDISCNGLSDGVAKAFLTGGTAPYFYQWTGGQLSESISNQPAGDYSVTVHDANNCPNAGSITLLEPPALQISAMIDNPVSCFGGTDGQISLSGTGGAGVYSYSIGGVTYQTGNALSGLNIGVKDLFIKDGNSCVAMTQETMTQPDQINISFKNIIDAKCNDPVGSAEAVVTGGNGGYAFRWFDDPTNRSMNTGNVLQNAIAGIYRVEVSDAKNCPATDLVAVSSIGGALFDVTNIVGVTCYGFSDGAAEISVTSGITPYSYSWSEGQTQKVATNLKAGNYFASVIDGLGCKTIKPLNISTPDKMVASYSKTLPNCVGDCDGAISVVATGGTQPYSYGWTSLAEVGPTVSGLCAGDYSLQVVDTRNCLLEELVNLPDPEKLQINANITSPVCLGRCDGSILVSGQGGTGPYDFQWQDGPVGSSYATICPGDYNVTMTDAHGCSTIETKTLLEGDPLPIDLGGEATLCVGQSKALNAGSNWLVVEWTSNTGFVSDAAQVIIKEPGSYFVKGIDAIGCIGLDTFKLNTSLDLLKAEFIMPSEATAGDTLVAIDISWPLPERVEWSYPEVLTPIEAVDPDFLFVILPQDGTFKIGMRSFLAECQDYREKEVIVVANERESSGGRLGYKDELVKIFSVSPNPNDGRFDVNVLLAEEAEIKLQVISFPKGLVEAQYDGAVSDLHQVNFDLSSLTLGMYFVLLRVDSESRLVRFVKK